MNKPKERRRVGALRRQEARDERTDVQQLKRLDKLKLRAKRERTRLLKRIKQASLS